MVDSERERAEIRKFCYANQLQECVFIPPHRPARCVSAAAFPDAFPARCDAPAPPTIQHPFMTAPEQELAADA